MDTPPSLPALTGADNGDLMVIYDNRRIKHAIGIVFEMIGGVQGMADWAGANRTDYYTKLLPKIIPKEVLVDDRRSIDDVVMELAGEAVDVTPIAAEMAVDDDGAEFYE